MLHQKVVVHAPAIVFCFRLGPRIAPQCYQFALIHILCNQNGPNVFRLCGGNGKQEQRSEHSQ